MKYMLMCCFNESSWAKLPQSQRDQIMGEYGALIESWAKDGILDSGAKLEQCSGAVTVRQTDGPPRATDGPFAETKEQLGGYHVVECANRDEAIALAGKIPTLPAGGAVEVRAVVHTE
jgi:hypothetical protein